MSSEYLFYLSFVSKRAIMAQPEGEIPTAPEAEAPVHPHSPRIAERVRSILRAGRRSRSRESDPERIERDSHRSVS